MRRGNKVVAEVVREFTVGTQAEGCAADDDTGALYVAEEDVGLWRYEAEPTGADRRVSLDTTDKGNLDADVEGIAIYYGERARDTSSSPIRAATITRSTVGKAATSFLGISR